MVLRRQTFAGHTLAMMAFPGAAGAALIGVAAASGYFVFCGAGALAIGAARPAGTHGARGASSRRSSARCRRSALAVGFLFVSLYRGVLGDLEKLLFGTFLGIIRRAGADARGGRRGRAVLRWCCWAAAAVRDRSIRTSRARGGAGARAVGRVSVAAGAGGRGDEPDHRRAAGVRAAASCRQRRRSCSPRGPG